MAIFESEDDLLRELHKHDDLVEKCVQGQLGFWDFCGQYNNFYAYYALDGHESDEEEIVLLEKYADRIELHRVVAWDILGKVCSDDDAKRDVYQQVSRFGSAEALTRLRMLVASINQKEEQGIRTNGQEQA
jgi:hypothetical protein